MRPYWIWVSNQGGSLKKKKRCGKKSAIDHWCALSGTVDHTVFTQNLIASRSFAIISIESKDSNKLTFKSFRCCFGPTPDSRRSLEEPKVPADRITSLLARITCLRLLRTISTPTARLPSNNTCRQGNCSLQYCHSHDSTLCNLRSWSNSRQNHWISCKKKRKKKRKSWLLLLLLLLFFLGGVMMMSWCLMFSHVIWHTRDKLWPMPKHGSIKSTYVRCMRV